MIPFHDAVIVCDTLISSSIPSKDTQDKRSADSVNVLSMRVHEACCDQRLAIVKKLKVTFIHCDYVCLVVVPFLVIKESSVSFLSSDKLERICLSIRSFFTKGLTSILF